jgi:serine/threonine-protein kinase
VLIDGSGNVKVTDFGIARAMESADDNLTQTGAVMGTATYFSPEQAQGLGVDARSDIYSLGVVLYEMVCGKTPFSGSNPVAVATKHVRDLPPRPTSINPNLSPAFESIILTCLAKDADDRYASAEDLRADLMRFRQGRAIAAQPFDDLYADDPNATMAVPRTTQATRAYRANQESTTVQRAVGGAPVPPDVRRRTGVYVLLLFSLLAILAGLLYLLAKEVGIIGEGSTQKVAMINVVGQDVTTATDQIEAIGLKVNKVEENNSADPDIVFAQDPAPETPVDKGAEVTIRVSKGLEKVKVPSVVGKAEETARSILEDAGFKVIVDHQPNNDVAQGQVAKQSPASGSEIDSGSTVTITVSSGDEGVKVPNVVGMNEDDAADALNNAGFKVKRTHANSASVDKGDVISQDPGAGSDGAKGDTVTIVVSDGVEQVSVPDVEGMTEAAAKAELTSAGFKVTVVEQSTVSLADDGTVINQNPNGGTMANKGSTVTITVATT